MASVPSIVERGAAWFAGIGREKNTGPKLYCLSGHVRKPGVYETELGVEAGGTTLDGRFTLRTVECLGSCGTAPMCQIDDDYHEDLTFEKIDKVLDGLK